MAHQGLPEGGIDDQDDGPEDRGADQPLAQGVELQPHCGIEHSQGRACSERRRQQGAEQAQDPQITGPTHQPDEADTIHDRHHGVELDEALQAEFRARAQAIADYLHDVPSLKTQIFVPEINQHASTLLLRYDQKQVAITPHAVADALRKGSPSIELHPATGDPNSMFSTDAQTVVVGVWMLQDGEDLIVAKRLHEVLMSAVNG